ncbi:MAG TPA: iron-sulfur cluster assembly protein, partial [Actinomycetota bacterium]
MSTTVHAGALERKVWHALRGVPDPEIPAVSVVDMGMVAAVDVDDGAATVTILPTFTGCPAIGVIESDVAGAVAAVDGISEVH